MEVIYNNKSIKNNEFLKVNETQVKPEIHFNDDNINKIKLLIMYDPDAVLGTHDHWIVSDIIDNNINNGKVLIPYKGPAPPPKTGKHRYIFELYDQADSKLSPIEERNMTIKDIREKFGLNAPIYKIQFISQNESGGKTRKTRKNKRRKLKRSRRKH